MKRVKLIEIIIFIVCVLTVTSMTEVNCMEDNSYISIPTKNEILAKLSYGMSLEEVEQTIGFPTENVGFGRYIPTYLSSDRIRIWLEFDHDSGKLIEACSKDGIDLLSKEYTATSAEFPVFIDNEETVISNPIVTINDKVYVPLKELETKLSVDVGWNKDGYVEITTGKTKIERSSVEMGYYDLDEWITTDTIDISITAETALTIADNVFYKMRGKDYINDTTSTICETDDNKYYIVCRCKENAIGGKHSVIIRKSDGKIIRTFTEDAWETRGRFYCLDKMCDMWYNFVEVVGYAKITKTKKW